LEENLKSKNKIKLVVSCDGGAASGKTTGAKLISKKYKLNFLSSGLLYRYAGYLFIKHKPKNQINFLKTKIKNLNYKKLSRINLHEEKISKLVSVIAKKKKIRSILKKYQKNFAKKYNRVCIEGRDISYAILPNADLKFYFECSLDVASKRRWRELKKRNKKIKLSEVKKSLKIRNFNDKNRKHNPLIKLPDSIVIRTNILNKSAMIRKMSKEIELKLSKKI
tara:strand:- start:3411 stop:4076 length:666 start_codon:yes stop_codon:yes gene_type:complete